jgi:DNA-binding transcriptional ArsR family regulator
LIPGDTTVQINALEARIVGILKDWYPITVEELRDELSLRKDTLERTLKSLAVKGIIVLEPLSDKTYIRLLNPEMTLTVEKRKKPNPRKMRPVPSEDDSIMYR